LTARIAIVTGAAGGIGRATALELARRGLRVALLDTRSDELDTIGSELAGVGSGMLVAAHCCSVSDHTGVTAAFEQVVAREGRIDVLVNCAGIGLTGSIAETPVDRWREALEVNLTGTFIACHAALRWMLPARSGHIVNVVSVAGKQAFAGQGAYCASKWGALGLTRVLAEEVRGQGIRVTAVCPGAVDTGFWDSMGLELDRRQMLSPIAVARSIAHVVSLPPGESVEEIDLLPDAGILSQSET